MIVQICCNFCTFPSPSFWTPSDGKLFPFPCKINHWLIDWLFIIDSWFLLLNIGYWLINILSQLCHLYLRISSINVVLHGICSCARVWHPSWVTILQTVHFILIPFLNKKKVSLVTGHRKKTKFFVNDVSFTKKKRWTNDLDWSRNKKRTKKGTI